MNNTDEIYTILLSSCVALNKSRFQWTKQGKKLYTEAAAIVGKILPSLTDIQSIAEAELLYLENELTFCRPSSKKV
jgi:hypothetical protein